MRTILRSLDFRTILAIDERCNYSTLIAKKTGAAFASITTLIPKMIKKGIMKIVSGKSKRTKYLKLTRKGLKYRDAMQRIKDLEDGKIN